MLPKRLTAYLVALLLLQLLQTQTAEAKPVPGRKKAFGMGLLGGALAGAMVHKALSHNNHNDNPQTIQQNNNNNAPNGNNQIIIEKGEVMPNGCYQQTVKEPDPHYAKQYTETVQLICPPSIPAVAPMPISTANIGVGQLPTNVVPPANQMVNLIPNEPAPLAPQPGFILPHPMQTPAGDQQPAMAQQPIVGQQHQPFMPGMIQQQPQQQQPAMIQQPQQTVVVQQQPQPVMYPVQVQPQPVQPHQTVGVVQQPINPGQSSNPQVFVMSKTSKTYTKNSSVIMKVNFLLMLTVLALALLLR